jgi:uncharacterized protein (TIGR03437 family)
MRRILTLTLLCSFSAGIRAADFQNGQAARVVIGQSSFSAHDAGITASALSISNGRLYVADSSKHLLAFDLSQIPLASQEAQGRQGSPCAVCGFAPVAVLNQSVIPGISAVSVSGKAVAVADTANRRVLVWRDASSESASKRPDVVLGTGSQQSIPIDASTLIEPISVALDGERLFVGDGALHRVLVWNALPTVDNQPADAVLGQPNFASSTASDVPAADTILRPVAMESDGANLFVADSVNRRILVFTAGDFRLDPNAITNSANLSAGPLAPGTLITIAAAGTVTANESAEDADQPLPSKLSGVQVVFDGVALPLLSVSQSEIRAQLPYDLGNRTGSSLYVRAERDDHTVVTSTAISVAMIPAAPGLFAFPGEEPRAGIGVYGGAPITAHSPARPGEPVTLWAAGLGPVIAPEDTQAAVQAGVPNPYPDAPVQMPITATLNGVPAAVTSATLPQGSVGIYEVRIVVPAGIAANAGGVILSISQNGRQSNSVTIPVASAIH